MVSMGDDPRLEDDASAQIFKEIYVLVSRGYANEVPQELAYDIFDIFPYCILASSQAVMTVSRIELLCD